ncbi:MAG: transposase [Candidatus Competibacteraceae bacterium]
MAYQLEPVRQRRDTVLDLLVWIGRDADRQPVRLIEGRYHDVWYRYLTNKLDPQRLPVESLVALYGQRWRIEDAYAIVKRLLRLAYFWCGAQHAVEMQLWATWRLYAVLVDLTDAVAEALEQPFAKVSLERVYRGLYCFTQAYHRGEATDVVIYLAANATLLGMLKRPRKPARQQQPACVQGP